MAESKRTDVFSTKVGRAVYPSVYARNTFAGEIKKYEVKLLLKKEDMEPIVKKMRELAAETWGPDWKKKYGESYSRGGGKIKEICFGYRPGTDKGYPEGTFLLSAKSERKPLVVEFNPETGKHEDVTAEQKEIINGENISLAIHLYAVTKKEFQAGVYAGLDIVKIHGGGEPLTPTADPDDVFDNDDYDEYPEEDDSDSDGIEF